MLRVLIDPERERSQGSKPDALPELKALASDLDRELGDGGKAEVKYLPPMFPGELPGWWYWSIWVTLGPSGAIALARATVAWLRQRTSDVSIEVWAGRDKRIKVSAKQVRKLGSKELKQLTEDLATAMNEITEEEEERD